MNLCDTIRMIPGYDPYRDSKDCVFFDEHGEPYTGDCWFDEAAADRAVEFFPRFLTFSKGDKAGKPFVLEPWQKAIVANLFGWKRPDGTRRYRHTLILIARKNGKSELCAGIAVLVFLTDNEPGMECISCASEATQAAKVFKVAKEMVQRSAPLAELVKVYERSLVLRSDRLATYQYVSGSGDSRHGDNLHLIVCDELHVVNRALIEAISTGTGSRKQPLQVYLTTADWDREGSVCNEMHDRARRIRDGDLVDPFFLPVLYELTKEEAEDWTNPDHWLRANPNLGVSKDWGTLHEECKAAQDDPSLENNFKRLHLNIRTQTRDRLISTEMWGRGDGDLDITKWHGKQCVGAGLDLGNTSDLTSLCLLFKVEAVVRIDGVEKPITNSTYEAYWWNWSPRDKAEERGREDGAPYLRWETQGFLTLTDGNEVDYAIVRRDIVEIGKQFGIPDLQVDRLFQGAQLCQELSSQDGFEITQFGQGFKSMAAPMKDFMSLVKAGRLLHGNNPIAKWCASHLVAVYDARQNMAPDKKKSGDKIDPMVALVMAIGYAVSNPPKKGSVYETEGVFTV